MVEKRGIELIPKEIEAAKERKVLIARLRWAGFGVLGASLGLSLLLWGGVGIQTTRLTSLEEAVGEQTSKVVAFAETEEMVLGLAAKSAVLRKIFTERDYFSLLLEAMEKSTPPGLTVTGLSARRDEARVTISGETLGYVELADFLKNLVNVNLGGTLFTEAALTSVTLDPASGKVDFVAEVTMRRNGLKKSLSGGGE